MDRFIVDGGYRLGGIVNVHGAKNSALPILAATVLNKGISVIENVPMITDVLNMLDILKSVGCHCSFEDGIVVVDSVDAQNIPINGEAAAKVRTSVLFCGSFLGRFKSIDVAQPGGCAIGSRPIDIHLDAFKKMGVQITEDEGRLKAFAPQLEGVIYNMPFPSVGATQNIMMAAMGANGVTVIENAAKEPEVVELGLFLKSMGGGLSGLGTSTITIKPAIELHDAAYMLRGDRIVAGTYLAACAACGGEVTISGIVPEYCSAFLNIFKKMGCMVRTSDNSVLLKKEERLTNQDLICTGPFPEFPTDMQSQLMSVMSVAEGRGVIVESIFESRFKNVTELRKMGADIYTEGKKAYINGVSLLKSATVKSYDLRGGAAMIIAGLTALGTTTVEDEGYIGRGYEDIKRDLKLLGAHIK